MALGPADGARNTPLGIARDMTKHCAFAAAKIANIPFEDRRQDHLAVRQSDAARAIDEVMSGRVRISASSVLAVTAFGRRLGQPIEPQLIA